MSIDRRSSVQVCIGAVQVGGDAPIVVQSMTNTDTADVAATVEQVEALARAGSELVRITVNTDGGRRRGGAHPRPPGALGCTVPLIGDFHFNGHKLLHEHPGLRRGAGQVPHQPRQRRPRQQARPAVRRDDRDRLPLRQAGAHRRELGEPRPGPADAPDGREHAPARTRSMRSEVMREAMVRSALVSARARRGTGSARAIASSCPPRSAACRT